MCNTACNQPLPDPLLPFCLQATTLIRNVSFACFVFYGARVVWHSVSSSIERAWGVQGNNTVVNSSGDVAVSREHPFILASILWNCSTVKSPLTSGSTSRNPSGMFLSEHFSLFLHYPFPIRHSVIMIEPPMLWCWLLFLLCYLVFLLPYDAWFWCLGLCLCWCCFCCYKR